MKNAKKAIDNLIESQKDLDTETRQLIDGSESIDYHTEEKQETGKEFDYLEISKFLDLHKVDVIRGEDYQYQCWIDGECYYNALTFLGALVFGIKRYNKK